MFRAAIKLNSTHGPIKMTKRPISVRDNVLTDWCQPNGQRPNAAVPIRKGGRVLIMTKHSCRATYPAERNRTNKTPTIHRVTLNYFPSQILLRPPFNVVDRPPTRSIVERVSFTRIPSIKLGQPQRRRLITPASMPTFLLICILIELFSKILRNGGGTARYPIFPIAS